MSDRTRHKSLIDADEFDCRCECGSVETTEEEPVEEKDWSHIFTF